MIYVEAPNTHPKTKVSVFLAGGITGCPDWQRQVVDLLRGYDLIVYNPRRQNFPIDDPNAAKWQIQWEHQHLRIADAILFWFPHETLCPIVLYELGAWSMTEKPIFVGAHPQYKRFVDVVVQTGLTRPDVEISIGIGQLIDQFSDWLEMFK